MRNEAHLRPFEVFDASKRKHREYYHDYMASGTWGYCPVRFAVDEDCNNLAAALQRKMLEYYVAREFKATA